MTMRVLMRLLLSRARPAGLRERSAERLEDRLENVMRVGAVEQTHVQRQRRTVRQLAQERGDDVGRDAAEPRLRQVDVRNQQRLLARLERDVRERLGGRNDGGAVAADGVLPQRCGERLAECATRRASLLLRVAGRNLEREIEG